MNRDMSSSLERDTTYITEMQLKVEGCRLAKVLIKFICDIRVLWVVLLSNVEGKSVDFILDRTVIIH